MTKHKIETHFSRLTVKVDSKACHVSGIGVYDVSGLDLDKEYLVLATYIKVFNDKNSEPVFLLAAPGEPITEKACSRFMVQEVR